MPNTRQTPRRLRRLSPWVIAIILTVVIAFMILGIWVARNSGRSGIYAGFPQAFSTVIHEMFVRDFEQDPAVLHALRIGTGADDEPVPGFVAHSIALTPVYNHKDEKLYKEAMWSAILWEYNYITLGQACYLALQGEDSSRIRYFFKIAEQIYAGSSESELYAKLDDLYSGDESARELFARHKAYGLEIIRWRIPRAKLFESLGNFSAEQRYRERVERGEPDAQFLLALCYARGEGIDEDLSKAVKWWRKAAEQGHAGAQYYLGFLYYHGHGIPKDLSKAHELFLEAAGQGY